jgi:hypothetical protein
MDSPKKKRPRVPTTLQRPPENLRQVLRPRLDGRTAIARQVDSLRATLLAELGPQPTRRQEALVAQVAELKIRLLAMDRAFLRTGEMTVHDSRVYLAWSNSYVRALRLLGIETEPLPPGDPMDAVLRAVERAEAPA